MAWAQGQIEQWVITFWLVLTRLGVWFLLAPGSAPPAVPGQARLFLAVMITLVLLPVLGRAPIPEAVTLGDLASMLIHEAAIGGLLGLAVALFVSALHLAGQLIAHVAGVQIAEVADPQFEGSLPVHGKLYELVALAVFFAMGAHRRFLAALLDSFIVFPPASPFSALPAVESLEKLALASLVLALRVAAPVVLALLLATIVLGLVSRTVPQLNILAVGLSLNSLVLLAVLLVSLGSVAWLWSGTLDEMLRQADRFWMPRVSEMPQTRSG